MFYRIAQEALWNVAKHAGKDPVTLRLAGEGNELCLTVEDAGPGFDPKLARTAEGFGLKNMRERAQLLGGSLPITSEPGRGTTVEVRAPLHRP